MTRVVWKSARWRTRVLRSITHGRNRLRSLKDWDRLERGRPPLRSTVHLWTGTDDIIRSQTRTGGAESGGAM